MSHKAVKAIETHAADYTDEPLFLYYSLQLVHEDYEAPDSYIDRCQYPDTSSSTLNDDLQTYCGMNVMLDESIANITCALKANGMGDNTIVVIASDNGGSYNVDGSNYPFRGSKGSLWRGALSVTALVHSDLVPESARGTSYNGLVHVTDWLPTLMGRATEGKWTGSYTGAELDGVDVWEAITTGSDSPRKEILHYSGGSNSSMYCIQHSHYKLNYEIFDFDVDDPEYTFTKDLDSDASEVLCSDPSLVDEKLSTVLSSTFGVVDISFSDHNIPVTATFALAVLLLLFFSIMYFRYDARKNFYVSSITPFGSKQQYGAI